MNRRTYKVIIERLRYFADNHDIINRFSHGQIDLSDLGKDTPYPYMHVVPETFDTAIGQVTYNFTVFFFDMPRDKSDKSEYQAEALSDCSQLALDLLATINGNPNLFGREVELLDIQGSITPFMEEMKHVLTGVTLTLGIVVPYDYDWCTVPGSYSPGGSGSGGSPSPGISFAQSLVINNGVVTFVNDQASPGDNKMYATDDSGVRGWVDIPGGGGGAVDSVNGQTGVVELDAGDVGAYTIAETNAAIDAEATIRNTADVQLQDNIDSEASTRGAADTTLQNNITAEAAARSAADASLLSNQNANYAELSERADNDEAALASHVGNTSNPHSVTKAQVGLTNVTDEAQTKASIVPNTVPAANEVLMGNAGGTAYEKKTVAQAQVILGIPILVRAPADVTNATTVLADTGLNLPVVNGGEYWYEARIPFESSAAAIGIRVTVNGNGTHIFDTDVPSTTTTRTAAFSNIASDTPAAGSINTPNARGIAVVRGYFLSAANQDLKIQFAAETGGTVTIYGGASHVRYERTN